LTELPAAFTDSTMQHTATVPFFTQQNAAECAKKSHTNGRRIPKRTERKQAADIQINLHYANKLLIQDMRECEDRQERARIASALASVAKGWDSISARILILKGKPGPGTMSPAERRASKEQRNPPIHAAPRPAPKPASESPK
jgi:hypothetical protein